MLADEYTLIFLSLSAHIRLTEKSQQKNLTSSSVFQSASVPADVTQDISTAESPTVSSHVNTNNPRFISIDTFMI
jgi:hypothetical protein